jgi:predicted metal-dependent phosphoesterase TrpH
LNDAVDFHLHSTASDGVLTPTALAQCVHAAGVKLCALTDHDTTSGLEEMACAATALGLSTVTGIELSSGWHGRDIHIVGLGFDPAHEAIEAAISTRAALRQARMGAIAARLDRAGAPGSEALARLDGVANPTRTHLARALVDLGAVANLPAAFTRWLGRGRPGHIPTEWPSLEATVTAIARAGGVAVLAHPMRYMLSAGQRRTLMKHFRDLGGGAIEVVTGGMAPHQIETAVGLALRAGLEGSVGSDCHDPSLPWHRPGRLATLPKAVAPVWHRWGATWATAREL